jgi:hypothetical protein
MWMPRAWLSVRDLLTWHTLSQVGARRNALLASTELIQRRREHHEVEEFFRGYEAATGRHLAARPGHGSVATRAAVTRQGS